MSQPIDIYECPRCPSAGYKQAVMRAVLDGARVQREGVEGGIWHGPPNVFNWDWATWNYRIDPASRPSLPKVGPFKVGDWVVCHTDGAAHSLTTDSIYRIAVIRHDSGAPFASLFDLEGQGSHGWFATRFRHATPAEIAAHLGQQVAQGHNPARLTVSQVGEGWRLLDEDEIIKRPIKIAQLNHIGAWRKGAWTEHGLWEGSQGNNTYRTRLSRAELAALIAPRPKVKVPLTSADYPPVFWVRNTKDNACWAAFLVTAIQSNGGFYLTDAAGKSIFWAPNQIMDALEYSSDRRTWAPCHKLVDS